MAWRSRSCSSTSRWICCSPATTTLASVVSVGCAAVGGKEGMGSAYQIVVQRNQSDGFLLQRLEDLHQGFVIEASSVRDKQPPQDLRCCAPAFQRCRGVAVAPSQSRRGAAASRRPEQ